MRRDPAIILLAAGQTLIWASTFYLFPALLLRWESDPGWTKPDLTLGITLAVLASALASPLAGRAIDRGQGAALMGGSALLGGAGLWLLSEVSVLWQFHAAWGLIGLAMAGALYDPCFAIVTRARGADARRGIIAITLVAGFAGTISFPTVFALAEALGWRTAVRIIAAAVVVGVAPLLWLGAHLLEREGRAAQAARPAAPPDRGFLRRGAFWLLAAAFGCLSLTHGATLHHLLPMLDERGLGAETAVLAAAFIGPMQVAGRLAMMASERHLSNHGVALAAYAALGLALVFLLTGGATPLGLAGFVLFFGSAYGTVSILRPLLTRAILGQDGFGAKSGALAVPYLVGSALSPYAGALIWAAGGYGTMLGVLLVVVALGCVFYLGAARAAPAGTG